MITLADLRSRFRRAGTVEWIGVRPDRETEMLQLSEVEAGVATGLAGDRFAARRRDSRAVTLIQAEHLAVVASLLGRETVSAAELRRNIVVSGINLMALKNVRMILGSVVLEITGQCHPCSKMEKRLGEGAYNALRGHGGMTARVVESGAIAVGDKVWPCGGRLQPSRVGHGSATL